MKKLSYLHFDKLSVTRLVNIRVTLALLMWISLSLSKTLSAQTVTDTLPNKNVVIIQDSLIKFLMEQNTAINEHKKTMPGYRVQLASSNNRKNVLELKEQFVLLHPEAKAYFIYQQPYFKLRIGDFQTRMEANQFLQIVLKEFDSAFIVPDDISVVDEK